MSKRLREFYYTKTGHNKWTVFEKSRGYEDDQWDDYEIEEHAAMDVAFSNMYFNPSLPIKRTKKLQLWECIVTIMKERGIKV